MPKPRITRPASKVIFGQTFYTIAQLARKLGVSESLLNRHSKDGRLTVHRIGRLRHVSEENARAYIDTLQAGPRLSERERRVFRGALNNWAMPLYPAEETQLRVRWIRELVDSESFEALLTERPGDGERQAVWLSRGGDFLVRPVIVRGGVPKKMSCPACEASGEAPMVKLTRKAVNLAEGTCSRCEAIWRVHWLGDRILAFLNADVVEPNIG